MAYTPTEWKNGDVITAEKLNNIEEGIETVSDEYEYIETETIFFEGELTTASMGNFNINMATFVPLKAIDEDFILVKIDDTIYELPKIVSASRAGYGEIINETPVFTTYPCAIAIINDTNYFITESPETHSIKIYITEESMSVTESFSQAVKKASDITYIYAHFTTEGLQSISKTMKEIRKEMALPGKPWIALVRYDQGGFNPPCYYTIPLTYNPGGHITGYFTQCSINNDENTIGFDTYTFSIDYIEDDVRLDIHSAQMAF